MEGDLEYFLVEMGLHQESILSPFFIYPIDMTQYIQVEVPSLVHMTSMHQLEGECSNRTVHGAIHGKGL